MVRILEDYTKKLLSERGIEVPRNWVASSPAEVRAISQEIGKSIVIKALIPASGKGRSGGVKFAGSPDEAEEAARNLLGTEIMGYEVEKVLVEEKLEGATERFASITYSPRGFTPLVLVSRYGGIEIEELLREHTDALVVREIDPLEGLKLPQAEECLRALSMPDEEVNLLAPFLVKLYKTFEELDCRILEINPVTMHHGRAIAIGTILDMDEDALYRHPELEELIQVRTDRAWRAMTSLEKEATKVDALDPYRGTARYTEMDDGDIGFLCGGGGASLTLFDALMRYGGKPANYTEFGGNPQEDKVYGLTKVVLAKKGIKGLFVAMNITNNTQTDVVARGVARALKELKVDLKKFPVVVRLAGLNDFEAKGILGELELEYYSEDATLEEVAKVMVERIKAVQ